MSQSGHIDKIKTSTQHHEIMKSNFCARIVPRRQIMVLMDLRYREKTRSGQQDYIQVAMNEIFTSDFPQKCSQLLQWI